MSKVFTHLAGGLNLSAGFSPIPGARVAAVPMTHSLEDNDKLSPNTTSRKINLYANTFRRAQFLLFSVSV